MVRLLGIWLGLTALFTGLGVGLRGGVVDSPAISVVAVLLAAATALLGYGDRFWLSAYGHRTPLFGGRRHRALLAHPRYAASTVALIALSLLAGFVSAEGLGVDALVPWAGVTVLAGTLGAVGSVALIRAGSSADRAHAHDGDEPTPS